MRLLLMAFLSFRGDFNWCYHRQFCCYFQNVILKPRSLLSWAAAAWPQAVEARECPSKEQFLNSGSLTCEAQWDIVTTQAAVRDTQKARCLSRVQNLYSPEIYSLPNRCRPVRDTQKARCLSRVQNLYSPEIYSLPNRHRPVRDTQKARCVSCVQNLYSPEIYSLPNTHRSVHECCCCSSLMLVVSVCRH
jgi:hypothetical protein